MNLHGTTLLVSGPLPPVCLKCATDVGVAGHRHRFAVVGDPGTLGEVADAASLLSDVAGGALGVAGFVRTLAATREAELELPLCRACAEGWARARGAHRVTLVVGVVAMVAGVVALGAGPRLEGVTLWIVVALSVALAIFFVRGAPGLVERLVVAPRALVARRIDERGVVLGGVSERWRDVARGAR